MVKKQTFETALKQLEDIVKEMESGDLPIEDAMKKFEEGIRLSRFCTRKLDEIEQKITVLMEDASDGIVETPFSAENGGEMNRD